MELFYYNKNNLNDIIECGIDEEGWGPLFGNVYAAVVIWPLHPWKFKMRQTCQKIKHQGLFVA